jgi:non-specific serine/threonine protein kinase/serine/threonine-protein kinase
LGVLLYELLTGSTPLTQKRSNEAALVELLRAIREEEPPKPSTRLSESKDSLPSISAQRQMEPAKLAKLVRGELDWIVMKALEKDRNRRYETANSFAQDVQRYLADEPVLACPPSAGYRFRKFARRHRTAVWTTAAFAALLVAGTAVSITFAVREKRANDRSRESAADANAVLEFMQMHVLAAGDPQRRGRERQKGLRHDVSLRAALDAAEPKIVEAFAGRPAVESKIRATFAEGYLSVGDVPKAIGQYKRALELARATMTPDDPERFDTVTGMILTYLNAGRVNDAAALLDEFRPRILGAFGPDDPRSLNIARSQADVYLLSGRMTEGLALVADTRRRAAEKLGWDHPIALNCLEILVENMVQEGQSEEAIRLLEPIVARLRAAHGPDDPDTLAAMRSLARAFWDGGRRAQARSMLEDLMPRCRSVLGPKHPRTLQTVNDLANAYACDGPAANAIPLLEPAIPAAVERLGDDHKLVFWMTTTLANAYSSTGRPADALRILDGARARADHHPQAPPKRKPFGEPLCKA